LVSNRVQQTTKRNRCRNRSLALFAALLLGAPVLAQTIQMDDSGSVRVVVHDVTDLPIEGATVTLACRDGSTTIRVTNERGEATFDRASAGSCHGVAESIGFSSSIIEPFSVRAAARVTREVILQVAGFVEQLEVRPDDRADDSFTRQLTADQLAALPEDPEELGAILRQLAGDGADIRVNGFSGGRLPLGSRIQDVRIRDDVGAASSDGGPRVEILTTPSDGWRNNVSMHVGDSVLNARNAFYGERPAGRTQEYLWQLDGPLVRGRTSLSASIDGSKSMESQMMRVAMPGGTRSNVNSQPANHIGIWTRVEHQISPSQTLRVDFTRNSNEARNQGLSEFDLPERAFSSTGSDGELRVGHHATLRRGYVNDFRFATLWNQTETSPVSDARTIRVLDAFTSGGAQQQGQRLWRTLQAENEFQFTARQHHVTFGASIDGTNYHGNERTNFAGTFTFASLDSFEAGQPATFVQRLGDPSYAFSMLRYSSFVQDDYRVRPNLMINLGLRNEFQTHLSNRVNLSPRLGASWTPSSRVRTTLRASLGVVHTPMSAGVYLQTLLLDGRRQSDIVISNPGYPDPFAGGVEQASRPASVIRVDPQLDVPFTHRYSLELAQPIGKYFRFRGTLSRQIGDHLFRSRDVNAPIDGSRPDPSLRTVTQLESTARSLTDAFQTELSVSYPPRRLWGSVRYVIGTTMNETDGPFSLPPDSADVTGEWGPARGDARHRVSASVNTDLPGSLRLNAEFQSQSATPYNVTSGTDSNGDGIFNERPTGITRNSTRGEGTANLDVMVTWRVGLSANQSASAAAGVHQKRGGDDPFRIELFAHATNALNFVNPQSYSGVLTSPFFGLPTSAAAARRVTVGTRVWF
jgi:hypothetical protein